MIFLKKKNTSPEHFLLKHFCATRLRDAPCDASSLMTAVIHLIFCLKRCSKKSRHQTNKYWLMLISDGFSKTTAGRRMCIGCSARRRPSVTSAPPIIHRVNRKWAEENSVRDSSNCRKLDDSALAVGRKQRLRMEFGSRRPRDRILRQSKDLLFVYW